jgi:trans-2,3-dihydro-3-hydroxyanthranilate isomerase
MSTLEYELVDVFTDRPVAAGRLPGDGESAYAVRQGVEIRRTSHLECTVHAAAGFATGATVSGHVVPVARGEIAVPPFVG